MLSRSINLYRDSFRGLSHRVWLLSLVMLINRSGAMVIPFLTIYLTIKLGFSLPEAGYVMSFFGLGSVVGSYMGGWLSDRIRYLSIMFWSLLVSGLMFMFLIYISDLWTMCFMVFSLSVVADSFRPANMAAIAEYSTPESLTRSISLVRLAINLGYAIGPAIGGFMAYYWGYAPLFIADGLTCIGAAFLLRFLLTEPISDSGNIEEEQKEISREESKSPYQDKPFLLFLIFNILNAVAFFQIIGTLPVYFREELHFSELLIGILMATNGLIIALVEMPIVFILENRYAKMKLIALGALINGISLWVLNMGLFPAIFIASACMVLISFGEILNFPFTNAFALDRSTVYNRGKYMGLYTSCFSVALVLSPAIGMHIANSAGFASLWLLMGGLSFVATTGYLLLRV